MIANPKQQYMTPQDYLEWEERQDAKYEIHLTSVNFHCPISLLYEDVQFPTRG